MGHEDVDGKVGRCQKEGSEDEGVGVVRGDGEAISQEREEEDAKERENIDSKGGEEHGKGAKWREKGCRGVGCAVASPRDELTQTSSRGCWRGRHPLPLACQFDPWRIMGSLPPRSFLGP